MIEIKIPKEITDYKEKFLFGLTVRQCVSVAAAIGAAVPLYIFGKEHLGADVAGWLVLLVIVPIFGFGFFRYNGMTFEQLVARIFRQMFIEPQKRKYEELPIYWDIREEIIENEIVRQTAKAEYSKKKGCNYENKCKGSGQEAACKTNKSAEKIQEENQSPQNSEVGSSNSPL